MEGCKVMKTVEQSLHSLPLAYLLYIKGHDPLQMRSAFCQLKWLIPQETCINKPVVATTATNALF